MYHERSEETKERQIDGGYAYSDSADNMTLTIKQIVKDGFGSAFLLI